MKKTFIISILAITLLPQMAWGQRSRLANAGKPGLRATSLEEVLRLRDEDMDLATATLIASEYWSDIVHGRRYLEQLDAMALEIRNRLRQQRLRANFRAIPVINDYLFNELGYKTVSHADDPNDLFLHSVMDRRQGYCLSLSVLYLALAERLGIDVYGVVVPGHFFVRYDSGRTRFNIETTSNGVSPPDEHYVEKFNVPQEEDASIYMKNLTKRQTLGCFFNNLGNVYSEIGDIETAQLALERAVAINPALSESRANLGNIYLQTNRVNDAIQQYRAALELNPRDPKTYNNLGNAYAAMDWPNDAIAAYRKSLELDSNFTDAYQNMALLYIRQEKYGQALSLLTQAATIDPTNVQIHSHLGHVYYSMDRQQKAITEFQKVLSLEPDYPEAYYGLGRCYRKLNRTADEIYAYKKALAIKPTMLGPLIDLGTAYFNQGQYELAIEHFGEAAKVKPNDALIQHNLGSAYYNNKNYQQAVNAYLEVVKIDPDVGDVHQSLAWSLYELKKYDLAWKHINIAKRLGVPLSDDLFRAIQSQLK